MNRYKVRDSMDEAALDRCRMSKTGTGKSRWTCIPMHTQEPRSNEFKVDLMRRRIPKTHRPMSPMVRCR
jgi:hypothetical protein